MAESRRQALERWREEKRRQKARQEQEAAQNPRGARRVISHRVTRGAPVRARVVTKHRETQPPSTPAPARRISEESATQEADKYDTVRTPASKTESSSAATTEDSTGDMLSAGQRKKRRRSYISPGSNAPSLLGGAQRILTPTRILQHESDDGGMDGDLEGATPEISAGPRRVSVLAQRRRSDEGPASMKTVTPFKAMRGEQVEEEEQVASRETIWFGSIGAALRVPHRKLLAESEASPVTKEAQVKEELQNPLSVRVVASSTENSGKADAGSPQAELKLVFPERVPLNPMQQESRPSIDRTAPRKSISSRTSLDDSKPVQSLSERLEGNPKWEMDDFIVTKNLGQGKFGNVYLAKEKCSNVTVALKVLFKSPLTRDGGVSNLKREVEIQARLHHPNVLRMHGYFYDDACVYLVLEYAPYGELYKELAKEKFFVDAVAAHYVAQVVEALKYCHSCNVIHRDIKPENLLLGYNKTIKLADFGWSVHAPKPYSLRKTFCGTPDYLSPEMVRNESYDYRTDSWSLGVLTYELLVGATPFYCENHMEMYKRIELVDYQFPPNRMISDDARSFIAGLLKRNPRERMSLADAAKHPWIQSR